MLLSDKVRCCHPLQVTLGVETRVCTGVRSFFREVYSSFV